MVKTVTSSLNPFTNKNKSTLSNNTIQKAELSHLNCRLLNNILYYNYLNILALLSQYYFYQNLFIQIPNLNKLEVLQKLDVRYKNSLPFIKKACVFCNLSHARKSR